MYQTISKFLENYNLYNLHYGLLTIRKVLPPANGKKLWRVKKSNASEPSNQCLNNSLRISQGEKFTVKRPPLKRPKNKPGLPKDFVFVDLSPIKLKSQEEIPEIQQLPSPALSLPIDFSDSDSIDSVLDEPIGLGIDYNWDYNYQPQYDQPQPIQYNEAQYNEVQYNEYDQYQKLLDTEKVLLQQNQQIQQLQLQLNQLQQVQLPNHKRSKSLDGKKQIQFKSYTGPKKKNKRCVSESVINTSNLNINNINNNNINNNTEDFNQLLNGGFTPNTDISDDDFKQELNMNLDLDFDYIFDIN